ncbi:thioredoxin reductase (NADPH) [Natranaerovirga hydrolytica]|uniref:Thioredoxin reductase n=1 Tax=Natranaerovirga hydrolytica TaxID=680378 RepID=A0A4R1MAI8_9FIRM|nr:thioredoxin-disulfide reductase [Natranaerovirga hydrolytica]TCK87964.1 thioredoxin reductase (NADPH) [Natranaerovirga hydrolytica]
MENNIYDLIIIGTGPAGLSAAIYAERAKLKTLLLEKNPMSGGQVVNTYEVDNYPGLPDINGFELGMKFREHAEKLGAQIKSEEVKELDLKSKIKKVVTEQETYETKAIIFSTGAQWRKLGVEGEKALSGLGVSYCATCDGAFFRDKTVAVVGGGDVAVEDAIFLSRFAKKVYLIHRRDELRAVKILQEKLFEIENIEVIWDTVVDKINGKENVTGITITSKKTSETKELAVDGTFIAIGTIPHSDMVKDILETDDYGYIITDENCKTSIDGVFAAGDVRKKLLRQIITAAADGATSVYAIDQYIIENF